MEISKIIDRDCSTIYFFFKFLNFGVEKIVRDKKREWIREMDRDMLLYRFYSQEI